MDEEHVNIMFNYIYPKFLDASLIRLSLIKEIAAWHRTVAAILDSRRTFSTSRPTNEVSNYLLEQTEAAPNDIQRSVAPEALSRASRFIDRKCELYTLRI